MRVAFRVDASLQIGAGHVMRCLALADALSAKGAHCHFISREHPGHLLALVRQRGFEATPLPAASATSLDPCAENDWQREGPAHAPLLGCDWPSDVRQTAAALATLATLPDWLVVDHYALDQRWESALRPHCQKLMVIDDLADRRHDCEVLLDQNLGRLSQDYAELIPETGLRLIGPQYALLRPEFSALRAYSLKRRQQAAIRRLLITMGGVDLPNATGQVLDVLKICALPSGCQITVVMGSQARWQQEVDQQAQDMPWPTEVLVNTSDMARLMADSDLAIGAAGITSWERCCLGLPTLLVVLADNQQLGAVALHDAQAARLIGRTEAIAGQLPLAIDTLMVGGELGRMSIAASAVTEGMGVDKVLAALEGFHG